MPLRCTECGDDSKTFESRRQARGHVKFKSGGKHGDAQEVPDGWIDLFEEVDEGNESGSDDDSGTDDNGSASDSPDDSDPSDSSGSAGGSDGSESSSGGLVRKVLDTDLRELIRG